MKRYGLKVAILFLLGCVIGSSNGQNKAKEKINRNPAVAGSFYPSNRSELEKMLEGYFNAAPESSGEQPLALVVPHAGYVFSGQVAATGYRQLNRNASFRHIFIIGPAHRVYFDGVTIYTRGDFVTPLGIVPVDPLAAELVAGNKMLSESPAPHKDEHCIEVQLPFLQFWLKQPFSIIPVLVGGESGETARQLGNILAPYFTPGNLFIISTDFSHYPAYDIAKKADQLTADAIAANNSKKFISVKNQNELNYAPGLATSICGWMPMLTLLQITEKDKSVVFKKLVYKNSGDTAYGDRDQVVGYWAIAVSKKSPVEAKNEFELTQEEKSLLLKIARKTVKEYLTSGKIPVFSEKTMTANLLVKTGAFVTLNKNRQLRGCIGSFTSQVPLYNIIQEMAIAAATQDSRFMPVTPDELNKIHIEISVLTPLRRIQSMDEFKLGRDGIYIKKGDRSGTFLPQVAIDTKWSTEEFMGHCARDKAGIGWDGWKDKDAELFTYQALVFGEEGLPSDEDQSK
jgi:MEMO1 family protein